MTIRKNGTKSPLRAVHCFAFSDLRLFLHFVSVYKIVPDDLQSVFLGERPCKVCIPCFRCIFQPLIILRIEEHETDIIIHKAAKKAFDELGVKKLPTIKSLQVEFAELLTTKKEAYAELKKVRDELRDVAIHSANYEELRDLAERDPRKEKGHGRE